MNTDTDENLLHVALNRIDSFCRETDGSELQRYRDRLTVPRSYHTVDLSQGFAVPGSTLEHLVYGRRLQGMASEGFTGYVGDSVGMTPTMDDETDDESFPWEKKKKVKTSADDGATEADSDDQL